MNPPPPEPPAGPLPFQDDPSTTFLDPHASKIAPDDPRLQLARAAGRTLKKGPAIAIATSLLTALTGAGALALQPASGPKLAKGDSDPAASATSPVLPESLQNAALAASSSLSPPSPAPATEPSGRTMPFGAGAAGSAPLDRQRQLRADEEEKALSGPILFDTRAAGAAAFDAPAAPLAALATTAASAGAASHPPDDDPNRQTRKNDFLESDSPSGELGSTLQSPGGRRASSSAGGALSSRTATRSICTARPRPTSRAPRA